MKLTKGEIVLFALVAGLVLVPVLSYERWGIEYLYNSKRLIEVGLLFLGGGFLIFSSKSRNQTTAFIQLFGAKIKLALATVLVIGGLSSVFTLQTDWALLSYAHCIMLGLLTLIVGAITWHNSEKAVMYVKVAVVGVVFFYLARVTFFYLMYQFGDTPLWPGDLNKKALFSFSNIRFFNQIQTWTIPILASLGWYYWNSTTKKFMRWGISILIVGWGILVFASGARGTILGVVCGILLVWAVLVKNKWPFFKYFTGLAFMAILMHYLLFELFTQGGEVVLRTNNMRPYWREVITALFDNPILGHGPMHYASLIYDNHFGHPHNWFLQFGYEWGIIVAFILLGLFVWGLFCFGRQLKLNSSDEEYSNQRYWIKFGLFWSMLAGFVHGFFSGLAVMPLSQIWFVLVVGVSMGLYFDEHSHSDIVGQVPKKGVQYVLIALTILAFAGYVNWGMQNPIDRSKVDAYFYENTTSSRAYPRFWQQGKIGLEEYQHSLQEKEMKNR